jgi:hypothetical protein
VAKRRRGSGKDSRPEDILFEDGDVRITKDDVRRAIEEARERVGPELAELLTAPTMTEEEMDAIETEDEAE